ncbi:MAG: hypothetical protein JO065_12305 [Acidobacteria bacterium]|nr:hypothetical protein [Acidobacteriota bacterium]
MPARIRLASIAVNLANVGFRTIVHRYLTWEQCASSADSHSDLHTARFYLKSGTFSADFISSVAILYHSLKDSQAPRRLCVNYISTCALQFAVRIALQQIRHGHSPPIDGCNDKVIARLARKLELTRKRLKREIIAKQGNPHYSSISKDWREFTRWVRLHLLYCSCLTRRRNAFYRARRADLDRYQKAVVEKLAERNHPLPDRGTLRRLLRQRLANLRRGKRFDVPAFFRTNIHFAVADLSDYVCDRTSPRTGGHYGK